MNSPPKITEMVFSCSAMGCTNRQGEYPNLSFHRFPKNDRERRSKWTAAIRRKYWEPGPYARVCGEHFILGRPCVDCHAFEFMQRALQDLKKTAFNLDARTEMLVLRAERRALCDCMPTSSLL
uniref:NELL2-interacting cell ontogeny regulator 1 n=1 Tax=Nothobranchius furzeri TaxID=105023 RepID=A0A8C6KWL5_NOTFU